MVIKQNNDNTKSLNSKGSSEQDSRARKIDASTAYETCTEQLSPFGGLLGLIKFLDLIKFEEIFEHRYIKPSRKPKLGNYRMVIGILMLLFIGFNRVWHFTYIRLDAMICGFFQLTCLPVASTFWRYVDNLGINQANSFLNIIRVLRERVWQLCGLRYQKIHLSTDTTVETIYGNQQGGRKGHNTKNRGKKGYRPVLCFIDETREYLIGKLRKGETMSGEEVAKFIKKIKSQLPGCVKKVLFRGDGEFFSWQSVAACIKVGFDYIIANKGARPPFDPKTWYRPKKRKPFEYNSCIYQPSGWKRPCRFVAKREGLDAIPSAKFKNNYAYFQIVMLAYNIWRYFKMMAETSTQDNTPDTINPDNATLQGLMNNQIRIARLRLLLIAAKVVYHSKDKVKYSIHDTRTPYLMHFLNFLDNARSKVRPWVEGKLWPCRYALNNI